MTEKIIIYTQKMKKLLGYKILKYIIIYFRDELRCVLLFIVGALEIVKEHRFEKKANIKTDEIYFFKDNFSLYKDGLIYQPTPYCLLEKIIDYLKPKPEDIFVDFGCGKGRAVFFVALQKLRKVIGIELNKELIDIAHRNLINFKLNKTAIEFINDDVANFRVKEETIFFMFNPFGCQTLQRVLDNIKNSLLDNPRQIRIVYCVPTHRFLLDNEGWLVLEGKINSGRCLIWNNKF